MKKLLLVLACTAVLFAFGACAPAPVISDPSPSPTTETPTPTVSPKPPPVDLKQFYGRYEAIEIAGDYDGFTIEEYNAGDFCHYYIQLSGYANPYFEDRKIDDGVSETTMWQQEVGQFKVNSDNQITAILNTGEKRNGIIEKIDGVLYITMTYINELTEGEEETSYTVKFKFSKPLETA